MNSQAVVKIVDVRIWLGKLEKVDKEEDEQNSYHRVMDPLIPSCTLFHRHIEEANRKHVSLLIKEQ